MSQLGVEPYAGALEQRPTGTNSASNAKDPNQPASSSQRYNGFPAARSNPQNPRRPVPSPLQSSYTASQGDHHSSPSAATSPRSPTFHEGAKVPLRKFSLPSSDSSQPRSPREALDDFIAQEASHYQPIPPETRSAIQVLRAPSHTARTADAPASMPGHVQQHRANLRPMPVQRNTSIDSTTSVASGSSSLLRSGTPLYKSSKEIPAPTHMDVQNEIHAAGGSEAAILLLLKEKRKGENENRQLWTLVERQRDILKKYSADLDKAQRDRDRYKEKFKQLSASQTSGSLQRTDMLAEREMSQSPAQSDDTALEASPVEEHSSHSDKQPSFQTTPLDDLTSSDYVGTAPDTVAQPVVVTARAIKVDTSNSPRESKHSISIIDVPAPSPKAQEMQQLGHAPKLSITHATPILGSGPMPAPERTSGNFRKAPPAPLNLSQPIQTSAHLHQATSGNDSDSEYDDDLEVDEIPSFERGRRKTREEDDRVREIIAAKEASRSKSKKSKSKSKSKPPKSDQETALPTESLPPTAAPQHPVPEPPLSPRLPQVISLANAVMSPAHSDAASSTQRSVLISPPLLSPGLPVSPRPGDRPMNSPVPRMPNKTITSPPMSPRFPGLPLSPRAPKQPIPLPLNTPLSAISPHLARAEGYALHQTPQTASMNQVLKPISTSTANSPDSEHPGSANTPTSPEVYRGLVDEKYPSFLLPPNALPVIDVKVDSSRLRPSRQSVVPKGVKDVSVFVLGVFSRSDRKQLWRVEKSLSALVPLHERLKAGTDFQGVLPSSNLFEGHAPVKVDARREALNTYFEQVLDTPMNEETACYVCHFFSKDVVGVKDASGLVEGTNSPVDTTPDGRIKKVGYLTKRGKNFGGWKARYFVLDNFEMNYFEAPGGAHLGKIKLRYAQLGRQTAQHSAHSPARDGEPTGSQYRHAIMILEQKKGKPHERLPHVLCAESDEERDSWVAALTTWLDEFQQSQEHLQVQQQQPAQQPKEAPRQRSPASPRAKTSMNDAGPKRQDAAHEGKKNLHGVSYEDTTAGEAPVMGGTGRRTDGTPSPPMNNGFQQQPQHPVQHPSISAPTNGHAISDATAWGNKNHFGLLNVPTGKDKESKKRSFFGFRNRNTSDPEPPVMLASQHGGYLPQPRAVFGVPLLEAVEFSRPIGVDVYLPAVVHRTVEYLRGKGGIQEEGIFRLSGSATVIRQLRDRFNKEGDVLLLESEQYYDIHAVAGVLKLYVRELPGPVLTEKLHIDFLKATDLENRKDKIATLRYLAGQLPKANWELLTAIFSLLSEINGNAHINKMNVRNLTTIFAPAMHLPPALITHLISEYHTIFDPSASSYAPQHAHQGSDSSSVREVLVSAPAPVDPIRSPRKQLFTDLPTPAYNQTSFSRGGPADMNTGFIPMRPSYEPQAPTYEQFVAQAQGEGYGSLNALAGSGGDKQKRRESGMLLVQALAGQKKPSLQRLREDKGLVREESAFE